MLMVSASALTHITTIMLVIYVSMSGSSGGPLGMGSGFGLLLFSGYFLLKYTMQKHNNLSKQDAVTGAAS